MAPKNSLAAEWLYFTYGGENWLKRQDTAALRFTKPDNRDGRGALVKESAPLLSFLGESGRKNSKEGRAK